MLHNEQIAAISVFGVYKTENRDAYDVIADFTKAAITIKKEIEITPEVIQNNLMELYSLNIPVSIIKGVLKNRLKDVVSKNNGAYVVTSSLQDDISSKIDELIKAYNVILFDLKSFLVNSVKKVPSLNLDEDFIVNQFAKFIIDDYADERLEPYFSAYIISKKDDKDFRSYFERFAAGLISYYGLQYFDNNNNIGSWPKDCKLSIFLDTEFLFDCAGYNDSYYKKIFDEFKSLVDEINKPYRNKPIIELKCLPETLTSFERVINTAKTLVDKKQAPDPSKEAILKIVTESHDIFDVETHRAKVLSEVKKSNISFETNDYSSYSVDPRYVTFGEEEYEKYLAEYSSSNPENAEAKINYYTKVLTIINGLRGGVSKTSFENCRYIFLSNSRIGHRIAYNQARVNDNAVPLATDIDWLVSRFWYKLNKSFVNTRIPLSLDIVARSQASLSEDVCLVIKKRFDDIKKKNLEDETKQQLYASIRTIPKEIELYDSTNLPDILDFISYEDTEAYITAQYKMKESAAQSEKNKREAQKAKAELETERAEKRSVIMENRLLKREKKNSEHRIVFLKIRLSYIGWNTLYWSLFTAIIALIIFVEYKLFIDSSLWAWTMSAIVDSGAIFGYMSCWHNKLHKCISKQRLASRIARKHYIMK